MADDAWRKLMRFQVDRARAIMLAGAPLALLAILSGDWRHLNMPRVSLPLIFLVLSISVLQTSATARQLYLLPLILPLCMLGGGRD